MSTLGIDAILIDRPYQQASTLWIGKVIRIYSHICEFYERHTKSFMHFQGWYSPPAFNRCHLLHAWFVEAAQMEGTSKLCLCSFYNQEVVDSDAVNTTSTPRCQWKGTDFGFLGRHEASSFKDTYKAIREDRYQYTVMNNAAVHSCTSMECTFVPDFDDQV